MSGEVTWNLRSISNRMNTQKTTNILLLAIAVLLAANLLHAMIPRAVAQSSGAGLQVVRIVGCADSAYGSCSSFKEIKVDEKGRLRVVLDK
jgi:hypothetical protein